MTREASQQRESAEGGAPTSDHGTPVSAKRTKARPPALAIRVATIFASLLMALVIAEVALRIVIPARTRHLVWLPGVHHTFKPRADVMPDYPPETHFSVSSAGLRGPELGKDDQELRVLAIGGSTTECLYHDDSKVWVRRVGELLGEVGGRRVWSGGAGRSGMNSGDHVLHTKYLLDELPRVDVVVMLLGVNDVNVALGMPETYLPMTGDIDPIKHEKEIRRAFVQVPGRLEDSWDYDSSFLKRTQIFQLVKRIKRQRTKDLAALSLADDDTGKGLLRWRDHRRQAKRILTEVPDLTAGLATFRANLGTIAELAAAKGTRLVLMTQPTLWRADLSEEEQKMLWMGGVGDYMREPGHDYYSPGVLAEVMKRFNEVTLAFCRERGLGCVDLASEIPKTPKIFYDDCHFAHTGSELVAQSVASFLKKGPPFSGK